jgi:uncharacterized protein YukE
MSEYLGLDPAAVRALATQMTHAAGNIRDLGAQLSNQLHNNTHWTGNDQRRFAQEWDSTHMHNLSSVAQALDDAASAANHNADEQESTSR